nr:anhydro-N-acetylmuramic acid kinase [Micromonospora craniellae]
MKIVGLMSGTSYDGVDVVAAEFTVEGDTLLLRPLGHRGLAYDDELRAAIGAVLSPGATTIADVCRLDNRLGEVFAEAATVGLDLAGGGVDVVVSPGQTVFHWVEGGRARGTLQLGAAARVATRAGVPVLADLRSADVAAGGQGAPLVVDRPGAVPRRVPRPEAGRSGRAGGRRRRVRHVDRVDRPVRRGGAARRLRVRA